MLAVLILMLILQVLMLFVVFFLMGNVARIANALEHIAQIWTAPADASKADEERRGR